MPTQIDNDHNTCLVVECGNTMAGGLVHADGLAKEVTKRLPPFLRFKGVKPQSQFSDQVKEAG